MAFSRALICAAVAVACLCCISAADKIPRQFELDLGLPPYQRWVKIYKELFGDPEYVKAYLSVQDLLTQGANDEGCDMNCAMRLIASYKQHFPDYTEELRGIQEVAPYLNKTLEELIVTQSTYELVINQFLHAPSSKEAALLNLPFGGIGCTSVLTCNKGNNILHGRNLDWPGASALAQVMFRVNYTLNHNVIFQSDQMPGHIGVLTGTRPGAYTMSINARTVDNTPTMDQFLDCMEAVPLQPIMTGFRYYIENFKTYDDLVKNITTTPYCAPRYSIIGGTLGRGARFQHNMSDNYAEYKAIVLSEEVQCTDNSWFIAQCNNDIDYPVTQDERRYIVMKELAQEQRDYGSSSVGLFRAMTVPKVKNSYTVHTTVMSPDSGEIVTVAYDI